MSLLGRDCHHLKRDSFTNDSSQARKTHLFLWTGFILLDTRLKPLWIITVVLKQLWKQQAQRLCLFLTDLTQGNQVIFPTVFNHFIKVHFMDFFIIRCIKIALYIVLTKNTFLKTKKKIIETLISQRTGSFSKAFHLHTIPDSKETFPSVLQLPDIFHSPTFPPHNHFISCSESTQVLENSTGSSYVTDHL